MSKYETFCKEIIKLSKSNDLYNAINEWYLVDVDVEETNCICGQHIINRCIIKNKLNGNNTIVGNVCIKKFMKNNNNLVNDMDNTIYNKKCKRNDKLYKKCKCGTKIKLKDLKEHEWKNKCYECYLFNRDKLYTI